MKKLVSLVLAGMVAALAVAAFAVASLLALLALVTLAAKSVVEWRVRREYEQALEPARAEE